MLHTCVQRFDVTENLEKFYKILGTKQAHSMRVKKRDGGEGTSTVAHVLW